MDEYDFMNECDFKVVSRNAKEILLVFAKDSSIATAEMEKCIDDVTGLFQRYYNRGLEPYQIAHILLQVSIGGMIAASDLDEAGMFFEYVRDSGDRARKVVTNNWPPINKDDWPFDPEQWPAE